MKLFLMSVCTTFIAFHPFYVVGHGSMQWPPTWFDVNGKIGMTAGSQCGAGCDYTPNGTFCSCFWFSNETTHPGEPTIAKDSFLRTYRNIGNSSSDQYADNPWMAPGTAEIFSPCGFGGGNPFGCPRGTNGTDCPGGGYGFGIDARAYDWKNVTTTEWKLGAVVEAAWGIQANHGGGYSYRLCKMPKEGRMDLTEECFQKTSLNFVGDMQWVQYGTNSANRTEFKANRTSEGTFPQGSQWTKNPIPACYPFGGWQDRTRTCPMGTMFTPPAPGLKGFGESIADFGATTDFKWSIVDKIQVPLDLIPGEYVLSHRWDCEQTPQVWNSCANIKIVAG